MENKTAKKIIACVLAAGGTAAACAAVNCYIRKLTEAKLKKMDAARSATYRWRYGDVSYVATGRGSPLLLIHDTETGGSRLEWEQCIRSLSKRYRVYAPDLPGYGRSAKPGLSYSAYLYCSFINDFIRDVAGGAVYAAGSGRGAAFAAMARSLEPQLYKKMILLAPNGFAPPSRLRKFFGRLLSLPLLGETVYNAMSARARMKSDGRYLMAHAGGAAARHAVAAEYDGSLDADAERAVQKIDIPLHNLREKTHLTSPDGFCALCASFF
ncbi:MAG: alpha/beta fold hydrolase [Defluviitaleaceae bacterium]|nr:alpha/beta fold hydrolase [Defluviitaleaceae bacterium]